jgi:uncharacterized repeat protein (TIGR01451 family)
MSKPIIMVSAIVITCALLFSFPPRPSRAERALQAAFDDEAELFLDVAAAEEALAGSTVTYTINVVNDGEGAAAAFTVFDELPQETTFVSCAATSGGVCAGEGASRSIAFEQLAPGASAAITIVAAVNCPVANDTEIFNIVDLIPVTPDPEADEVENETVFTTVLNPPPVVTNVTASPSVLWPPNHQWADVTAAYQVEDNCGPVAASLEVASNEPVDGTGDSDTAPDWRIIDDHLVQLRAERAGNGSGRTYTISVTATDSVGQSASGTALVRVPHSRKR